jgi:hypothetical protein
MRGLKFALGGHDRRALDGEAKLGVIGVSPCHAAGFLAARAE